VNQTQILLIVFVVLVVAAAFLFLWRRGGQKDEGVAAPRAGEGHGVSDGAAAAIEDVADQFLGVDSHPALPEATGPADPLTQIKGLGPKAQAQLNALGIYRYDQLAALDADQAVAVDAGMGAFRGRMAKDQWVAQAQHLAAGDTAGFESRFGKLGG
jgi:predicted flap endonuclease-1-like 5' DNA nuclease